MSYIYHRLIVPSEAVASLWLSNYIENVLHVQYSLKFALFQNIKSGILI